MAHLPVIADVFRVTLNWQEDTGVKAHNVFHVLSTSATEEEIFTAIDENLTTNMISMLGDLISLDTVDIIALDGSSATQVFTATSAVNGTTTGGIIPAAAAVLSLHTAQRGPRGRGRMYLGPIGESGISNGLLIGGTEAAAVTAWDDFFEALLAADITMVVASYEHHDSHPVLSFSMRSPIGTMRRRQDQLV